MNTGNLVGYNISENEHNLAVLCAGCGFPDDGTPIYEGDDWGEYQYPECKACGALLPVRPLPIE